MAATTAGRGQSEFCPIRIGWGFSISINSKGEE
nr:MAG TPA: hypothetical protein [Caudoviricetes sp.]